MKTKELFGVKWQSETELLNKIPSPIDRLMEFDIVRLIAYEQTKR